MLKYDCLIIGSGTACGKIAKAFTKRGKQVAVIENDFEHFGGTCINVACIPTKVLIEDSKKGIPYTDSMKRKQYIVDKFRDSKYQSLNNEENITLMNGAARFVSDEVVEVETNNGIEQITAEHIVINTGATSFIPNIDGLDTIKHMYTSTTMLEREELPENLLIVGGGYIGLEFAMMYANFGSKVTVINRNQKLTPYEDVEIRDELEKILKDKGITFLTGTEAQRVNEVDGVITADLNNGETIQADALLIATGRQPNTAPLKLENTSIDVVGHGAVHVHDTVRTSVNGIWATGDVRGEEQFTYISADDGRKVIDHIFGEQEGRRFAKPRQNVPYTVFTDPPLSRVGLTEETAKIKGYRVLTKIVPVHTIGRAYIIDDKRGQFKSVIDAETGKILGVSLLGVRSEELINTIKLAMDADWHAEDLRDQIFNHPVMSEAFNGLFSV